MLVNAGSEEKAKNVFLHLKRYLYYDVGNNDFLKNKLLQHRELIDKNYTSIWEEYIKELETQ